MPKNAPWHSAVNTRAHSSRSYVGASAHNMFPATNMPIRIRRARLRSVRAKSSATSGDPKVTLSAYAVTSTPAFGMLIEKLRDKSGSRPMMMNSDVPIPKAATASARSDLRIPTILANNSARWLARYSNRGRCSTSPSGTGSVSPPALIHAFIPPRITFVEQFSFSSIRATRTLVASCAHEQYR